MPIKLFSVVQLHAFVDKFDHVYKQRVTFQSWTEDDCHCVLNSGSKDTE